MALHDDLLEQASHLALREPRRPKQASLRRAVSASYYALFHMLAAEGAQRLAPPQPPWLRTQVRRAYAHSNMKDVCQQFGRRQPQAALIPLLSNPIEPNLVAVAAAFVALQEARHEADYDFSVALNRVDVLQKIQRAESAAVSWKAVRSTPNATVFLAALLLQRLWRA
jgi:hypothetical protein